jgi:hypothetical protein
MAQSNKFRLITIGNQSFKLPIDGRGNWGEETTAILEALAEASQLIQGPNDVLLSTANLQNNQQLQMVNDVLSGAPLGNLSFNTGQVLGIQVDFFIRRTYNPGSGEITITENGFILANYDGSDWKLSMESVGDTGIDLIISPSGTVQYTSTNLTGHISSIIRYKAKTIDEAS